MAPASSNTEDNGCSLWKKSSTVPIPIDPRTSAPMLATMKAFSVLRDARFISVPNNRNPIATNSCSPGSNGSMSRTTGTNPAAP